MSVLRTVLVGAILASSLTACNSDVPTSVEAPNDVRFNNGGGFGSGTRSDTTTVDRDVVNTNTATQDTAGGGVRVPDTDEENGGGFGSGT